ncbi:MAG TPA: hypothetical protein PKW95_04890 [bacterium]|nr:hypothetical protein [bacterium]
MFRMRPSMWIVWLSLLLCVAACGSNDDDDNDNDVSTDDDDDDDDFTDDDLDDDALDLTPTGEWSPPCQPPQEPPAGYDPYEAVWMIARFDDETLPFYGLYAYLWIDRYWHEGCSYTPAWTVLYGRDRDNLAAGGTTSGYRIEYGRGLDLTVYPTMRVQRLELTPLRYRIEFYTRAFGGWIEVETEHMNAWNFDYFAFYDARIVAGELLVEGETIDPRGRIDFERWTDIGGGDPTDASEGILQGYWLYSPLFWESEDGERLTTLTWHWVDVIEGERFTHDVRGLLTIGDEVYPIAEQEVDFAFAENQNSGGYLLRHAYAGELDSGEEFSYEVRVASDYRDRLPPAWEALLDPADRRQHPYVEGTLTFRGQTYTGGGTTEWRVTAGNPLEELRRE